MAQPSYILPAVPVVGGTTHINDHSLIITALSVLQGIYLIPSGGTTGQSLTKASATNGDFVWATITGGGDPGTVDHSVLINRDLADQHPISSIIGLEDALIGKADTTHNQSASTITTGTLPNAVGPAGGLVVVDYYKGGFGAAANAWPASRSNVCGSRTNIPILFVGPTSAPGFSANGDFWIQTA